MHGGFDCYLAVYRSTQTSERHTALEKVCVIAEEMRSCLVSLRSKRWHCNGKKGLKLSVCAFVQSWLGGDLRSSRREAHGLVGCKSRAIRALGCSFSEHSLNIDRELRQ